MQGEGSTPIATCQPISAPRLRLATFGTRIPCRLDLNRPVGSAYREYLVQTTFFLDTGRHPIHRPVGGPAPCREGNRATDQYCFSGNPRAGPPRDYGHTHTRPQDL